MLTFVSDYQSAPRCATPASHDIIVTRQWRDPTLLKQVGASGGEGEGGGKGEGGWNTKHTAPLFSTCRSEVNRGDTFQSEG